MANLITSRTPATNVPHVYYNTPGLSVYNEITLPAGVTGYNRYADHVEMVNRHALVGQFSQNLIITEFNTAFVMGLAAPATAPTLATAAAGTIPPGNYIGYLNWRHKVGSTLIHQSSLSPGSSILALNGSQKRAWSAIPTTGAPSRTTHVGLWVSEGGGVPKYVTEVTYGTATLTEDISAYGAFWLTTAGGAVYTTARNVPPYARFVRKYHGRAWYSGNPDYPYRIWFSEIDEMESVGSNNYRDMLGRETVTGLAVRGDELVAFSLNSAQSIKGYTNQDLVMRYINEEVGAVSHFGIQNIRGRLWIPAVDGVWIYDGGWRYMMDDLRTYWRDAYRADPAGYQRSYATHNPAYSIYKLNIPGSPAHVYVAFYQPIEPSLGGDDQQPWWSVDRQNRAITVFGGLRDDNGLALSYNGGTDGYVREEEVTTDRTDDGDTGQKEVVVQTKHLYYGDQSGGSMKGKSAKEATLFIRSDSQPVEVSAYGGDDPAAEGKPAWGPHAIQTRKVESGVSETSKLIRPVGLSGKGHTIELRVKNPLDFEFRGVQVGVGPGTQSQGRT